MLKINRFLSAAVSFLLLFEGGIIKKNEDKKPSFDERYEYEHVIVIGVDGAGNFHKNCSTPNMDKIFIKNGAWTDTCRASTPSISAQCWGSMLTGVKPYLHKLTNDTVTHVPNATAFMYPTFFALVRAAHPDAELGAFCNWNPINTGIIEKKAGVTFDTDYDPELCDKICTYIEDKKPELLFIQFDSVDHEGHSSGYGSDEYYKVIENVDGYVGKIYSSIKNAGILDDTLLIITADHGGINDTHGGASEEEMNVFFGAVGTSVNKTDDLVLCGRDLAAIVCYALGVDGNENWDSYIPQNMFLDNMTPEARPADEIAEHENAKTPAAGTPEAIENFIDMSTLRTGLFFDEGLADIGGKENVETVGTVYYPEGYYGSSLRVSSEGYLSFPNIDFADEDFTISFWIKLDDGQANESVIFSNKDCTDSRNEGFVYSYNGASKLDLGNGSESTGFDYSDPEDFTRWNHVTIVFDRYTRHVTFYSNFVKISDDWYKRTYSDVVFATGLPLNFGQDATGSFDKAVTAQFDDILIFDKVLSEEEIANLRNYYVK